MRIRFLRPVRWTILTLLVWMCGVIPGYGGIRLDGTEFQNSSDVGSSYRKNGQIQSSRIVYTLGQAVMVKGELPEGSPGTAFKIGLGYEYNVVHTTDFGCNCPNQGDADKDGFQTVFDLSALIDVLFAGASNPQDAACPTFRFDADCDGFVTALDLVRAIDYLFAGGAPPCTPCTSAL